MFRKIRNFAKEYLSVALYHIFVSLKRQKRYATESDITFKLISELNTDTDTQTETETKIETDDETDTNTETDDKTETEIEPDTNTETDDEPDTEIDTPDNAHLPGDINGDGKVNMKDITRLHQYINGWDVWVNEKRIDVNGDGKVNMKDVTRLHQYINGWDVAIC